MITAPVAPPANAGATVQRHRLWWTIVAPIVGLVSLVVIAWPRPALWLDEAQSVAIARRSLPGIVDGLRADGAPPIYYLLLHVWMSVFGTSDMAVRWLSILFAVAAVAVLAVLARDLLDRRASLPLVLLTVSNPFFVRYATETRMYALVMLEVAVGALSVQRWLVRRRRGWLVAVAASCWAVVLTHYWGISLVIALCVCTAVFGFRRRPAAPEFRSLAAAAAAGLAATAFWWPIMRFQSRHTGTPWTQPAGIRRAVVIAMHHSTGPSVAAAAVSSVLGGLFGIALACASGRLSRDRRLVGTTRLFVAVFIATLALSYVVTRVTSSAFVARYTMTMFPLQIVLATVAAWWLVPRRALLLFGLAAWGVGLIVTVPQIDAPRTRAPVFADVLGPQARPGDVILYCPDQLGPPLVRILEQRGVHLANQWVFPTFASPARVDWIDYGDRHLRASPTAFADEAVRIAGRSDVWLVLSVTHPPTEAACAGLRNALRALRPDFEVLVPDRHDWHEHDSLLRFPAAATEATG